MPSTGDSVAVTRVLTDLEALPDRLWERARGAARYALSNATSQDPDVLIRVALSTGMAVELLAMAKIAAVDSALLATDKLPTSRVMLSRANVDGQIDHRSVKTITAKDAVSLLSLIGSPIASTARANSILEFRNAAVHLAYVDVESVSEHIAGLVAFVAEVHLEYGRAVDAEFWGPSHFELVQRLREASADRDQLAYLTARANAVTRFGGLLEGVPSEGVEHLLSTLETFPARRQPAFESRREIERVSCPACGRMAYLHGSLNYRDDVEEQAEFDRDGELVTWLEVTADWSATEIECPVCGLNLDRAQLRFAPGIATSGTRTQVLDSEETADYWSEAEPIELDGSDFY